MSYKQEFMAYASEGSNAGTLFNEFYHMFLEAVGISDKPKDDTPLIKQAAAACFQAYYQHSLDAAFDKYGIPTEPNESDQCALCWCNTCINIGMCSRYPQSDGVTPPPCAFCVTVPMKPINAPEQCDGYAEG
jgi:hypothetical protein